MEILPPKSKKNTDRQLWKNDAELNQLIQERTNLHIGSQQYKNITQNIKKRVNWLQNKKPRIEAEEINEYANNRQIKELFKSMKADNSTFKETTRRIGCDPHKLKQHFVNHFNHDVNEKEPIELREAPDFIKDIRVDGMETSAPGFDELRASLNSLKNSKATNDIPAGCFEPSNDDLHRICGCQQFHGTTSKKST